MAQVATFPYVCDHDVPMFVHRLLLRLEGQYKTLVKNDAWLGSSSFTTGISYGMKSIHLSRH